MANILLVDDDEISRHVVRKMIERVGHQVEEAGDGEAEQGTDRPDSTGGGAWGGAKPVPAGSRSNGKGAHRRHNVR